MSQKCNSESIFSTPGRKPALILDNILDPRQGKVIHTLLEIHKTYGDIVCLELPKNQFVYRKALIPSKFFQKGAKKSRALPIYGSALAIISP